MFAVAARTFDFLFFFQSVADMKISNSDWSLGSHVLHSNASPYPFCLHTSSKTATGVIMGLIPISPSTPLTAPISYHKCKLAIDRENRKQYQLGQLIYQHWYCLQPNALGRQPLCTVPIRCKIAIGREFGRQQK